MANTKLNSWATLEDYFNQYGIKKRDEQGVESVYTAQDIIDSTMLDRAESDGIIDKRTRQIGKTKIDNYLADLQAQKALGAQQAAAENTALVNTAYNDYLGKKLASYLQEVQGNAGLEGYEGVTKGQAIDIANLEGRAQKEVQTTRDAGNATALQKYQDALIANTREQSDAESTLNSKFDEQDAADYNNNIGQFESYLELSMATDADGKTYIKQSDLDNVKKHISELDVSDNTKNNIQKYIDFTYKNQIKTDEEAAKISDTDTKNKITATTSQADLDKVVESMDDAQKAQYAAELSTQAKNMYKTSRKSGSATISSTFEINIADGKNKGFNDGDTTITVGTDYFDFDNAVCKDAGEGQAMLIDGTVYVKLNNGRFAKVRDYAGKGVYERLKSYLAGSYYDVSASGKKESVNDRYNKAAKKVQDAFSGITIPQISPY